MQVLLQSSTENKLIDLEAMTAVGGKDSSGIVLEKLKYKEDYLVLSSQGKKLSILPLKVKAKGAIVLDHLESFECKDLKVTCLNLSAPKQVQSKQVDVTGLLEVIKSLGNQESREAMFKASLQYVIESNDFDRGLIIGLNAKEDYEVVSHVGADPSSPWLSESLLQETLSSKTPLNISNVIGSAFEKNKSLMATGFMSVSTWPMINKGKVIGAIIAGSGLPHSGVDSERSRGIEILCEFIASDVASHLLQLKLQNRIGRIQTDSPLTSNDNHVHKMLGLAKKAAKSDLNIYIHGETGTGKELLSKWIHDQANQASSPFVAVNCAAIPENLVESTLFGHKKGSFTGAVTDQTGKFVLAHGGTLFLDEIGELPLSAQSKLLRAIQEKIIEPVGAKSSISISTRIVAASHKNLKEMVEKGEFREDLYYRLSEVELSIPALRDRVEDILLIAQEFLKEQYPELTLGETAKIFLTNQAWKGNVRELLSSLKRAALFCEDGVIQENDFISGIGSKKQEWLIGGSLDSAIKEFQKTKIREALDRTEGNRTEASKLLGVTPRTLFRHLESIKTEQGRIQ